MKNGGNGDRGGLYLGVRGQHLFDRSKRPAPELYGDAVGARRVGVHHSDQPHFSRLLQLVVDAGVMASKRPDADHRDINGRGYAQALLQT